VVKQLSEKEELMMHFLDIMHSHSRIIILHWIDNNTRINKVYLQEFFVKYLKMTLDKLKDIIKVPTFDFLTEKKKMKWREFIKDPSDIFDPQLILKSIEKFPPTRKNNILRCLNSIYKEHYLEVFPKF
jgi:hypothetical protein